MERLTNLQVEQSILGSLLLDETIIYKIKESGLKAKDFYYSYNETIYKAIKKIYSKGDAIDLITLTSELKSIGQLENCGGVNYITSLSNVVPTTRNINNYIDIVKDLALKRNINERLVEVTDNIEVMDPSDIISAIEQIKEISLGSKKVEDLYIEAYSIKRDKESKKSINTGFNDLDKYTRGLMYGTLTVLTGEPSSGKSTILNQIIANAIKEGNKAFIYSGELPSYQLKEWFVRTTSNEYHLKEFKNNLGEKYKDITDYVWDLVSEWIKGRFYIYGQDSRATENNLLTTIEHLHKAKGVRLFILDNLMTIQSEDNKDKNKKQEDLTINLKTLAKKYGLVVILVAHPNKSSSQNTDHSMYDVSGASEVINLADHVIKTIRNKKNNEERSFIAILKNRTTGKQNIAIRTYFDNDRKRFYIDESELKKDYGYDTNKQFLQSEISSPF